MPQLIDKFNRKITYLRISVTDHCNYRCVYCRDDDHKIWTEHKDILSFEEIIRVVKIFSELGVTKIRLTGGEPLLRKSMVNLVSGLKAIIKINDIALSTNAQLLSPIATDLTQAGINRANISLDSLDEIKFKEVTRGGDLTKVLAGIDSAIKAKMLPIKLNMVVMRGVNEMEIEAMIDYAIAKKIDLRFIETMPIGSAGIEATNQHYSEAEIFKRIDKHLNGKFKKIKSQQTDGPARNFTVDNTSTTLGIISAVSNEFCASCNRVRLTTKGRLILCLGQENSISLRDAMREGKTDTEITKMIIEAIAQKPEKHYFNSNINNIDTVQMVEIGG
jgi:cyclic pyranopterin phosphate synthase